MLTTDHNTLLLMTADPPVVAAVATRLEAKGHLLAQTVVKNPRELAVEIERTQASIVLVDIDPHPQQTLAELERLITRFPTSRFVAICTEMPNALLLEAMQIGIRRVISRQMIDSELDGVLNRLVALDHEASNQALVTVLSASGGCGASTIAVNLAAEMADSQKSPSLLVDLDCWHGALATYLGVKPYFSLEDVLNYNGPIDANLVRSSVTIRNERLHLLASPASVSLATVDPLPNPQRLHEALTSCRMAYHGTVVDAPRVSIDLAATLARASKATFLVFQLTVKDIRHAGAMLAALAQRGIPPRTVLPLANRTAKRQMIDLSEAQKALGEVELLCVRNDFAAAIQGLNFGQTLAEAAPSSTLRRDIQALLGKLSLSRTGN